jgi:hypothetical protein
MAFGLSAGAAMAVGAGGAMLLGGMGGGGGSPDYSGMNAAAVENAQVSKDALEWYKTQYYDQADERAAAAERANAVSDAQLASMGLNDSISRDYWDYQKNTFRPLEQGIVTAANEYDTAARREEAAGTAAADVTQAFDNVQGQQSRNMARMGINPNSGKSLAANAQLGIQQATALAGAKNKARDQIELQGYARKMDAANLGRGLASQQATSAGVALNAGNSSVANAGIPLAQAQQATATMGQGFQTAIQGNNSAGQLYGQAAQIQNASGHGNDAVYGALGNVAGAMIMAKSDENLKHDITPTNSQDALAAVEKTPVSKWTYDKGVADGGTHIGPMAQDVQQNMGDKVAPGGKQIDLVSMNGITMAAVKELSKKVDRISKKVGA